MVCSCSALIRVKVFPHGAFSQSKTMLRLTHSRFYISNISHIGSVLLLNIRLNCETQNSVNISFIYPSIGITSRLIFQWSRFTPNCKTRRHFSGPCAALEESVAAKAKRLTFPSQCSPAFYFPKDQIVSFWEIKSIN